VIESLEQVQQSVEKVRAETAKVIVGQEAALDQALIAILCNQHALVEGVPGVAKTLLVRTLSRILGAPFNRIQFTPDLMPADIIGTNVFNLQQNAFTLVTGPVFTTFLLADEINRAPAKTQSALLQAMQERCVTIDRDTHRLSGNFTVFATQNPIEYEGTYPLPEAQLDRFLLKITMDAPERDQELVLARRSLGAEAPEKVLEGGAVQAVLQEDELGQVRTIIDRVLVRDELVQYCVDIVRSTRSHGSVLVGAGPRATQALLAASRVHAVLDQRDFVSPDDVKALAQAVLGHRMTLRPEFELEGLSAQEVVEQILQDTPVPR